MDLDLIPPPAVSTPLSQTQPTAHPQSYVRLPARFVSAKSSAVPLPSQSSVTPMPLSQSLTPALNLVQPSLPRTDREFELPAHIAPVWKKARVLVPIKSGAIASRTVSATRRTVSRSRLELQTVASSRYEDYCCKFLEIRAMS